MHEKVYMYNMLANSPLHIHNPLGAELHKSHSQAPSISKQTFIVHMTSGVQTKYNNGDCLHTF